MPRPEKHVFVCTHSRPEGHPKGCCQNRGGEQVVAEFAKQLEENELFGRLRITRTGCLGGCELGPVVLVYPDGVMYGPVKPDDVPEIVREHVIGGHPVTHLQAPGFVW